MEEQTTGERGLIAPLPAKKIAIFGTTPSRMEGPIQDNSGWERWTIGPGGSEMHGWERLYEVHSWWPEDFKGYLAFLSKIELPREVWTMRPMPELMGAWKRQHNKSDEDYAKDIPGSFTGNKVIPRQLLMEKYGRTWFMSSISWLLAQALEEGATDIGLWGIDLEAGEEYISQFLGCKFFMDLARLVGVNVHLPVGCGLLRDPNPYPDRYETLFASLTDRKANWIRQAIVGLENQYETARGDVHRIEGQLIALRAGGAPQAEIEKGEKMLIDTNRNVGGLAANINQLKGELNATDYYRRMFVFQPMDPETPMYPTRA